jgi:hypothetical protein
MVSSKFTRLFPLVSLFAVPTAVVLALSPLNIANAQTPALDQEDGLSDPSMQQSPETEDLRPLSQDGSILSIRGGQRLMSEASDAVASGDYELAVNKLNQARQLFNQLSNFYQDLASSFSGIDNRIADAQRRAALETAQMRDQATYQLALVHRARNQPELAVPLLIQIIRSQQPTRDLGQQAYRQLYELGFVDSPYPRNQADEPTSNAPRSTNQPLN